MPVMFFETQAKRFQSYAPFFQNISLIFIDILDKMLSPQFNIYCVLKGSKTYQKALTF